MRPATPKIGPGGAISARHLVNASMDSNISSTRRRVLPFSARAADLAARATLATVFTALAIFNLAGFRAIPLGEPGGPVAAAALLANVVFLALLASTALTRLPPVRKASGVGPRAAALSGSFLSLGLVLLPKADLGPALSVLSTVLILVGAASSFVVLRWLGKSFSLLAEARRLVTSGPYRFVRHPLYLCEGLALLGVALQMFSPMAVAIVLAIAALQVMRMHFEEEVLAAAFPDDYREYAARTPRVVPAFAGRRAPVQVQAAS